MDISLNFDCSRLGPIDSISFWPSSECANKDLMCSVSSYPGMPIWNPLRKVWTILVVAPCNAFWTNLVGFFVLALIGKSAACLSPFARADRKDKSSRAQISCCCFSLVWKSASNGRQGLSIESSPYDRNDGRGASFRVEELPGVLYGLVANLLFQAFDFGLGVGVAMTVAFCGNRCQMCPHNSPAPRSIALCGVCVMSRPS